MTQSAKAKAAKAAEAKAAEAKDAEAKDAKETAAAEAKDAEAAEAKAAEAAEAKDAKETAAAEAKGKETPKPGPLTPEADEDNEDEGERTSPYEDAAGPRDVFGDTTVAARRFVDNEGNDLSFEDIFEDEDMARTFVTTKVRVYEVFVYPNTTTEGTRLVYTANRRVPRGEAEALRR